MFIVQTFPIFKVANVIGAPVFRPSWRQYPRERVGPGFNVN